MTIAKVLRTASVGPLPPGIDRELVIVNDGSTDRTDGELRGFCSERPEVSLLYRSDLVNHGKGWCVRQGIALATGDVRTRIWSTIRPIRRRCWSQS